MTRRAGEVSLEADQTVGHAEWGLSAPARTSALSNKKLGSGIGNITRRASEEERRFSAYSSLARRVVISLRNPKF